MDGSKAPDHDLDLLARVVDLIIFAERRFTLYSIDMELNNIGVTSDLSRKVRQIWVHFTRGKSGAIDVSISEEAGKG